MNTRALGCAVALLAVALLLGVSFGGWARDGNAHHAGRAAERLVISTVGPATLSSVQVHHHAGPVWAVEGMAAAETFNAVLRYDAGSRKYRPVTLTVGGQSWVYPR
jgi:hypothetical protein